MVHSLSERCSHGAINHLFSFFFFCKIQEGDRFTFTCFFHLLCFNKSFAIFIDSLTVVLRRCICLALLLDIFPFRFRTLFWHNPYTILIKHMTFEYKHKMNFTFRPIQIHQNTSKKNLKQKKNEKQT